MMHHSVAIRGGGNQAGLGIDDAKGTILARGITMGDEFSLQLQEFTDLV
jgi:hypothetical protein